MTTVTALPKHETFAQKWRKPLSRLAAVVGVLFVIFTRPVGLGQGWHLILEMVGFLFLIFAAMGRIWSLAYIAGRKNKSLCQSGPYSITRNPLYFFSFLGAVGLMLVCQSGLLAIVVAAFFLSYYSFVIRGEEIRLAKLHGQEFVEFCNRVPRFWPRFGKSSTTEATVELNLKPFTRGMRETFWFLAIIIFADALEWAHLKNLWPTFTLPF